MKQLSSLKLNSIITVICIYFLFLPFLSQAKFSNEYVYYDGESIKIEWQFEGEAYFFFIERKDRFGLWGENYMFKRVAPNSNGKYFLPFLFLIGFRRVKWYYSVIAISLMIASCSKDNTVFRKSQEYEKIYDYYRIGAHTPDGIIYSRELRLIINYKLK